MALNDSSKINLSLKKLAGKAHTSNAKALANELLPSGITMASNTIFGTKPSDTPLNANLYDITGAVEYVRFELEEIVGSDKQGYALKLPANYEGNANSQNPNKNNGTFDNSAVIYESYGALQLVPMSYGDAYEAKPYRNGNSTLHNGNQIFTGDGINWTIDYYNGILFQQDPPSSAADDPTHVEAFLYIGDYLDTVITNSAGSLTLAGLSDTDIPTPGNSQVLTYNSVQQAWEAHDASGGGGIERYQHIPASGTTETAKTAFTVTGMDFASTTPTLADTQVYLNGVLQIGGTESELLADEVDYWFASPTTISLVNDLHENDILAIFYTTTSFSTGKPFLLHTADPSFDNYQVLTAGDGISITTGVDPTELYVNNTGLVQRTKEKHVVLDLTETQPTSNYQYAFPNSSTIDFSNSSYDDNRIDIFINGILKDKGEDYNLDASIGTNKFEMLGNVQLNSADKITVIIF